MNFFDTNSNYQDTKTFESCSKFLFCYDVIKKEFKYNSNCVFEAKNWMKKPNIFWRLLSVNQKLRPQKFFRFQFINKSKPSILLILVYQKSKTQEFGRFQCIKNQGLRNFADFSLYKKLRNFVDFSL